MTKINVSLILIVCLLSACAPSPEAIQKAIAETQAAWTPTSTSSSTPKPTLTPLPTITSTPTSKPTNVPVVLYSDDFSNNQSGWLQSNNGGVKYQYSGGQYVISRPKGNYINWACANRSFTDAVLTVDTLLVSGVAAETGPVVLWRSVDNKNFYYLQITLDGYYGLDKEFRGVWQQLFDWSFSETINRGSQINKITIAFGGGTSAIYINDKYVTSLQDTAFTTGDICLGASSSVTSAVEVSFDNLVIYTIDSWTPPK
jgi:hypothetical protein